MKRYTKKSLVLYLRLPITTLAGTIYTVEQLGGNPRQPDSTSVVQLIESLLARRIEEGHMAPFTIDEAQEYLSNRFPDNISPTQNSLLLNAQPGENSQPEQLTPTRDVSHRYNESTRSTYQPTQPQSDLGTIGLDDFLQDPDDLADLINPDFDDSQLAAQQAALADKRRAQATEEPAPPAPLHMTPELESSLASDPVWALAQEIGGLAPALLLDLYRELPENHWGSENALIHFHNKLQQKGIPYGD